MSEEEENKKHFIENLCKVFYYEKLKSKDEYLKFRDKILNPDIPSEERVKVAKEILKGKSKKFSEMVLKCILEEKIEILNCAFWISFGKYLYYTRKREDLGNAIFELERISELVPTFELVWEALSECYRLITYFDKSSEVIEKELNCHKKLLELRKESRGLKLGKYQFTSNFPKIAPSLKRMCELNEMLGLYRNVIETFEELLIRNKECKLEIKHMFIQNKEFRDKWERDIHIRGILTEDLAFCCHYSNSGLWSFMGRVYTRLKDFNNAILCYERALFCAPDFQHRGRIYQDELKDYIEAITCYEEHLKANPNDFTLLYNLGSIYEYNLKNHEKAIQYYKNAAETSIKFEFDDFFKKACISINSLYEKMGNSSELIEFYKKIISKHPENIIAKKLMADVSIKYNKLAEGIESYENIIAASPESIPPQRRADFIESFRSLARQYEKMGTLEKEILYHKILLETIPEEWYDHYFNPASSYIRLSKIYNVLGNFSKASEYYNKALKTNAWRLQINLVTSNPIKPLLVFLSLAAYTERIPHISRRTIHKPSKTVCTGYLFDVPSFFIPFGTLFHISEMFRDNNVSDKRYAFNMHGQLTTYATSSSGGRIGGNIKYKLTPIAIEEFLNEIWEFLRGENETQLKCLEDILDVTLDMLLNKESFLNATSNIFNIKSKISIQKTLKWIDIIEEKEFDDYTPEKILELIDLTHDFPVLKFIPIANLAAMSYCPNGAYIECNYSIHPESLELKTGRILHGQDGFSDKSSLDNYFNNFALGKHPWILGSHTIKEFCEREKEFMNSLKKDFTGKSRGYLNYFLEGYFLGMRPDHVHIKNGKIAEVLELKTPLKIPLDPLKRKIFESEKDQLKFYWYGFQKKKIAKNAQFVLLKCLDKICEEEPCIERCMDCKNIKNNKALIWPENFNYQFKDLDYNEVEREIKRRISIIKGDKLPVTECPYPNASCRYIVICNMLQVKNVNLSKQLFFDLRSIQEVGPARERTLAEIGVITINQIAKMNPVDLISHPRIARGEDKAFKSLIPQIIKRAKVLDEKRPIVKSVEPFFLQETFENIYFFDLEYFSSKAKIFLFGIMNYDGTIEQWFLDDDSNNPDQERNLLVKFNKWLLNKKPILVTYCSKSADEPVLKKAFNKFNIAIDTLNKTTFFDLYFDVISTKSAEKQKIYLPIKGRIGLKTVADFMGYKRPKGLEIQDGYDAPIEYLAYTRNKSKGIKDQLLLYNKTDLDRLRLIFNELRKLFREYPKKKTDNEKRML